MRILIITDRNPSPPVNGLYVPLHELLLRLANIPEVAIDLAIPAELSGTHQFGTSNYFERIFYFDIHKRSMLKRMLKIVAFDEPPYSIDIKLPKGLGSYDFVVATPDGFYRSLLSIKKVFASTRTVLIINEPYYTVSLGQLLNWNKNGFSGLIGAFFAACKFPFVYILERKYLRLLDCVVVQTQAELSRFNRFVGVTASCKGYICANPIKIELLQHSSFDGNTVLIHAPRGLNEIYRFVALLSACLESKNYSVRVRVCVAKSDEYQRAFAGLYNVDVVGYMENISDVYRDVICAVVFTPQRYGLVNRVKEAMTAGVAVIALPEALKTLGDVRDGVNVLFAHNINEFVDRVLWVVNNRIEAHHIGTGARQYVLDNEKHGPVQLIGSVFGLKDDSFGISQQ